MATHTTIIKTFRTEGGPNNFGFRYYVTHKTAACGRGRIHNGPVPARYVGDFCEVCFPVQQVELPGPYGGSDGWVRLRETPEGFLVSAYSHPFVAEDITTPATFATKDEARAEANRRFKAIGAARTARRDRS